MIDLTHLPLERRLAAAYAPERSRRRREIVKDAIGMVALVVLVGAFALAAIALGAH